MEYITFKEWADRRFKESGRDAWPLNLLKADYRKYLAINVAPYNEKLSKQLSKGLREIKEI